MDELQRQVQQRQGQYGSSLSSCKLTLQAFTQFENSLQGIENKVRGFSSTADKMIREEHFDSRRIKHEIQEVERKWDDFCNSIKLYRTALDDSTKFFEIMDEVGRFMTVCAFILTFIIVSVRAGLTNPASSCSKSVVGPQTARLQLMLRTLSTN